jgi:hypothetical protein
LERQAIDSFANYSKLPPLPHARAPGLCCRGFAALSANSPAVVKGSPHYTGSRIFAVRAHAGVPAAGAGRVLATLLVALGVGCSRGATLEAKVATMPGRAQDGSYVPERLLVGARVALECDGGPARRFESDAAGRVSARFSEPIPNGCRLNVEKKRFQRRVYRVVDVCADGHDAECEGVSLSARLLPEGPP